MSALSGVPTAERAVVVLSHLSVRARGTEHPLVDDVGFELRRGECLAIVGESGAGKSLTARALLGLLDRRLEVDIGGLSIEGIDLTGASAAGWRRVRGRRIALIHQDALVSLDPLRRVEAEVAEAMTEHRLVPRQKRPGRVLQLLESSGIPDPEGIVRRFPHQLSGGQRQRALIASALSGQPGVLVADEPTTALDTRTQDQLLRTLRERVDGGDALLLVTHDLSVVAGIADRVIVMAGGRIVETGAAAAVLSAPKHDYTRKLLDAVPKPRQGRAPARAASAPVLSVRGIGVRLGAAREAPPTLDSVSFELGSAETLGVVGESGAGKSTLARVILGLVRPETGEVRFEGIEWNGPQVRERDRRRLRQRMQFIPQDPLSSFDPRYSAARVISEGLPGGLSAGERRHRVSELVERVRLDTGLLDRSPRDLSGGQRQRLAIARALAPAPSLLIADEPTSALDVTVQAEILDLLDTIREEQGTSLLLITHDLGVVRRMCDRVLVLRAGKVAESGPADEVIARLSPEPSRL